MRLSLLVALLAQPHLHQQRRRGFAFDHARQVDLQRGGDHHPHDHGRSGGAATTGVFGALDLSGSSSMTYASRSQSQIISSHDSTPWIQHELGTLNMVFNQECLAACSKYGGNWSSPLAVATYTAATEGDVNIGWRNDGVPVGLWLDFFERAPENAGTA